MTSARTSISTPFGKSESHSTSIPLKRDLSRLNEQVFLRNIFRMCWLSALGDGLVFSFLITWVWLFDISWQIVKLYIWISNLVRTFVLFVISWMLAAFDIGKLFWNYMLKALLRIPSRSRRNFAPFFRKLKQSSTVVTWRIQKSSFMWSRKKANPLKHTRISCLIFFFSCLNLSEFSHRI